MEETFAESPYYEALDVDSKQMYKDLISRYVGRDPFIMKMSEFSKELRHLPTVEAVDITNYLVLQTFFYTVQQMKAYKRLEAYNLFVSGCVQNLGTKRLPDDCRLVFARVNRSQGSGEAPLKTWIIAKEDGEVIAAHCNCTASLSESCSHVAAVLFSIEAEVRARDAGSCTSAQCRVLMPSNEKEVPAAPVAEIDFFSAKSKKLKPDCSTDGRTAENEPGKCPPCPRVKRGSETYCRFLENLRKNCPNSVALMFLTIPQTAPKEHDYYYGSNTFS
uniref:SWIM-type domain-containing protein n=1 Tax=Nothobranchius kadleci TaxID=1051664 RepID=A0A1A8DBE7_NOTKA